MKAFGLVSLLLLLGAKPAQALVHAEGESVTFDLGGSAKLFPLLSVQPESALGPRDESAVGLGSARLNGLLQTERLSLEAAYHLFPVVGDEVAADGGSPLPTGGFVAPVVSLLRIVDLDRQLTRSGDDFVLLHNFDRLVLTVLGPGGIELRVGRQAIGHGSARLLPATDIFSPFSPATLDNEFKQGLDAIRLTIPIGELSELELLGVLADRDLPDSLARGVYLTRVRTSFPELFDVSIYGGSSYGSPTLALDVSGDLGGATVYGEALARWWSDDVVRDLRQRVVPGGAALPVDGTEPSVRATLGGQYFFPFDLDVIVELHWNGAGATERDALLNTAFSPEFLTGEIFLLTRAHLATAVSYGLTDLSRLSLSTITSLIDGSTLITPSYYWDAAENASVSVGALIGAGRRLDAAARADEFGLYPYVLFADLRYYF